MAEMTLEQQQAMAMAQARLRLQPQQEESPSGLSNVLPMAQSFAAAPMEMYNRNKREAEFKQKFGEVPAGYKVMSDKEFLANRKTATVNDPRNPQYYLVKKEAGTTLGEDVSAIVKGIKEDPLGVLKGVGESIVKDPWQLAVPVIGASKALATAAQIAQKVGMGAKATAAAKIAATSAIGAGNVGLMTGGLEAMKQASEGEDLNASKIAASAITSMPFGVIPGIGSKLKDWKTLLASGKKTEGKIISSAQAWLNSQGIKATPEQVKETIVNYPLSKRDISGAPIDNIKDVERMSVPREPKTPDAMAEAMGARYAKEMAEDFKAGQYTKEATKQYGGMLPKHTVVEPPVPKTPAELGQTAPRIPTEVFPPEAATPEQLGQLEPRIPEGPTPEVQPTMVTDPSTGMKMPAMGQGINRGTFRQSGATDIDQTIRLATIAAGLGGFATGAYLAAGDDEEKGDRFWGGVKGGIAGALGVATLAKAPTWKAAYHQKAIDSLEYNVAKGILAGKEPQQIFTDLGKEQPELVEKAFKSSKELDKQPMFPSTPEEAALTIENYHSNRKQTGLEKGFEDILGLVSTSIKNESPAIFRRARDYEHQIQIKPHEYISRTDDFKDAFRRIVGITGGHTKIFRKGEEFNQLSSDLFSGRFDKVVAKLTPEEVPSFHETLRTIDEIGDMLVDTDIITNKLDNYWPRMMKDREGYLASIGKEKKAEIEQVLEDANAKMKASHGRLMNAGEESIVLDLYTRGYPKTGYKPGFTKERKLEEVTPEMVKFYEHPIDGLHTYIQNAITSVEKAKLFGKDLRQKEVAGVNVLDLDSSIGSYLQTALSKGEISKSQVPLLKELFMARYGIGETSPNKIFRHWKNISNASLLGTVYSAGKQAGDIGTSLKINGFKPTILAVVSKLTGDTEFKTQDLIGLDRISEEFVNDISTDKYLRHIFRGTGFTKMDVGMKDIHINSTLNRARTSSGVTNIINKYKDMLSPDELRSLIDDIKTKKKTPLVKEFLFNELSDVAPISKLETTKYGLTHPDARILYQLKSYMLAQGNWIRNNIYKEIKEGNKVKGIKDLASYMLIMGTTQTGVQAAIDWAMGRDVEVDAVDVPLSVLKMFGANEYSLKKIKEGRITEAAIDFILPPVKQIDKAIKLDESSISLVPGMKPIYELGLGGKEKYAEKQEGGRE